MKIWKIASGGLSIAVSLFVVCQSFWGGALNLLAGDKPSGAAGMVVAAMLLAGALSPSPPAEAAWAPTSP